MVKYILIALFLFSQKSFASVSKDDYLTLTNALSSIYGKKIEASNNTLKFTLKNSDQAPNAYASKSSEGLWEVTVISSLLALKEQTTASLGIILCHEVGHFLGGEPYVVGIQLTPAVRSRAPKKMSCEGQADYFATSECMKALALKVPELFKGNEGLLNPMVNQYCAESYLENKDISLCQETLIASYQATLVYQKIMDGLNVPASFLGKIDNESTDRTLNNVGEYPSLDCRYETFIKGTLCSSLNGNVCNDLKWSRPACWFQEVQP